MPAKKSRSAIFYAKNPASRAKKAKYDTEYHKTPARKKYRATLARERRRRGIMGKGGKDLSHTKNGSMRLESPAKNRARQGSGGRPKRK